MTTSEPVRTWLSLSCECGWICDTISLDAAVAARNAHWYKCGSNDSTISVRVQTNHSSVRIG